MSAEIAHLRTQLEHASATQPISSDGLQAAASALAAAEAEAARLTSEIGEQRAANRALTARITDLETSASTAAAAAADAKCARLAEDLSALRAAAAEDSRLAASMAGSAAASAGLDGEAYTAALGAIGLAVGIPSASPRPDPAAVAAAVVARVQELTSDRDRIVRYSATARPFHDICAIEQRTRCNQRMLLQPAHAVRWSGSCRSSSSGPKR